jgi:hypothetical protein
MHKIAPRRILEGAVAIALVCVACGRFGTASPDLNAQPSPSRLQASLTPSASSVEYSEPTNSVSPMPTVTATELTSPKAPPLGGHPVWTELANLTADGLGVPAAFAKSDDHYLAVGFGRPSPDSFDYEGVVWRSADGLIWEQIPRGPTPLTGLMSSLTFGQSKFVAAGLNGFCMECGRDASAYIGSTLWTSADGSGWRPISDAASFEHAIVTALIATDDLYVAAGLEALHEPVPPPTGDSGGDSNTRGRVWLSGDGQSWTMASLPKIDGVQALVESGGKLLAIGDRDYSAVLLRSEDGHDWTEINSGVVEPIAIASSPSGFVVFGSGGLDAVVVSNNGVDWSAPVVDDEWNDSMMAVAWVSDRYVALGRTDNGAASWESVDGLAWYRITAPPHTEGQFGYFTRFAAAGSRGFLTGRFDSPGIQTWTVGVESE